jgi:putative ABC transport system permease protein
MDSIEHLLRDVRHAARALARSRAFSAAATVTLALGIGATTAVFSVVYGVMLRPLPFPHADRLVQIVQEPPTSAASRSDRARPGLTPAQVAEWRATSRTLEHIGYFGAVAAPVTGVPTPARLNGARVTATLFRALGVQPFKGRTFDDADETPGAAPVVVLSYASWRNRFGASEDIIGRAIVMNGRDHQVIGVMPEGFGFPSVASTTVVDENGAFVSAPEFWTPQVAPPRPAGPATGGLTLVPTLALVRAGVSIEQATAEANTLMPPRAGERWTVRLVDPRGEVTRSVRRVLLVFQGAVLFVLFIACANLLHLLLARAAGRRHELLLRAALGASRGQLLRYATAEAALIGVAGGAVGSFLAYALVDAFRALPPFLVPRMDQVRVDAVVLALATATSVGAGVVVGVLGAWRATSHRASTSSLVVAGRTSTADRAHRPSRSLVAAEVATGVVLLAGATVLLDSFVKLTRVGRGFEPDGVFTFKLSVPPRYDTPEAQYVFHEQFITRLEQIPGVHAVAASTGLLGEFSIGFRVTVDGEDRRAEYAFNRVTPGMFGTLGIPLRGRDFTPRDSHPRAQAAIINESSARRLFGDDDPIGRRIQLQESGPLEIVGVAGDTRMRDPAAIVRSAIYLPPDPQTPFSSPTYMVRNQRRAVSAATLRELAAAVDKDLVVFDAADLSDVLARDLAAPKLYGAIAVAFGMIAVLLAALGVYGVLAYTVGAQTREFGIRLALGARANQIVVGVMREMLPTVTAGLVAGTLATIYLSPLVEALLYNTNPRDPATLLGITTLFAVVASVACYLPARRATKIDPIAALRTE